MRVAIAADHNGVALKRSLSELMAGLGHEVDDRGTDGDEVVDYPRLCVEVCDLVVAGRAERGVIVGGSGSGEQIACNKVRSIRAALCNCLFTAEISRANNDANVVVIGAKVVAPELASQILTVWLSTPFKGGVHQRRLDQIAAIERGERP